MVERIHITAFLLVVSAAWGLLLIAEGIPVQPAFFKPLSTVVGITVLMLAAFEAFLWRLPFLHPWFVRVPNVRGTWKGTLVSLWKDPGTGESPPPIEAYVSIRQTFSSIQIRLMTKESSSSLLSGAIVGTPDGNFEITGVYRNTPKMSVRHRSPMHHGAILLRVSGSPPKILEGEYWTDRDTKGEMRFESRAASLSHEFDEASGRFPGRE